MTSIYRLNAKSGAGVTVVGWQNWEGTNLASLTDQDTGLPAAISLTVTGDPFTTSTSGALTDTSHYGVPEGVWDNGVFVTLDKNPVTTIRGVDITPGSTWTFTFAGLNFNSTQDRTTTLIVNGSSVLYNNLRQASTPMTPVPPVTMDVVATDAGGGEGQFVVTIDGSVINKKITFLTFAPAAVPTLTYVNDGDTIIAGESFTWNPANFTPTAATINGVACTAVTLLGANPPAYVQGAAFPIYNDMCTLTATEDAVSVDLTVKFHPPADLDYVIIRAPIATGTGTLKSYYADLAADDEVTFPRRVGSVFNSIDSAGNILSDVTAPQTWFVRRAATGLLEEINVFVGGVIPDPEITSVGTIRIGGTTAVTVENFSGSVNAGTLDDIALTSASDTSITVKGLVDTQTVPRLGSQTLTLTNGADSANATVEVLPPTGFGYIVAASYQETINGIAVSYLPVAATDGHFILYPKTPSAGKTTKVTNSGISTSHVGNQTLWIVDASTKVARSFVVTTTASAGLLGGGGFGGVGSLGIGI